MNAHDDEDYDRGVVHQLGDVHERVEPVLTDLRNALDRYQGYQPRFRNALVRVRRRRPRLVRQTDDRLVPHRVVPVARRPAQHARHRAQQGSSTLMNGPWGSVLTAMVTPFDDDGALDLDAAATLARWLADHGNDGLVVAGTTGEAPVLSEAEKLDLWRAVSEAVTIPIIAGTGTNNTAETDRVDPPGDGHRRRRRARRRPVLQPATTVRHRGPLPRGR